MKSYRFRYSTIAWILMGLVAVLCAGGLTLNIFNIFQYRWAESLKIVSYSLIALINLLLLVFVISVMAYGRYSIKNNFLYMYLGFIRVKSDINDIIEITHFKKSNKLVVYFKDDKYSVIVISPKEFDDFIMSLRNNNPKIYYDERIDGEDTPN